jgi:hypothetical protein
MGNESSSRASWAKSAYRNHPRLQGDKNIARFGRKLSEAISKEVMGHETFERWNEITDFARMFSDGMTLTKKVK